MLAALVLAATGCGGESSDADQARDVAERYLDATADQDAERLCEVMPPAEYGDGQSCEAVMKAGFIESGPMDAEIADAMRDAKATSVAINGDHARVSKDVGKDSLPVIKIDGRWYVDPAGLGDEQG